MFVNCGESNGNLIASACKIGADSIEMAAHAIHVWDSAEIFLLDRTYYRDTNNPTTIFRNTPSLWSNAALKISEH